jgi:MerR family redox-sensitive transcriptional activator SoxR
VGTIPAIYNFKLTLSQGDVRTDELLTIGELARRAGVATSTLRYYEDRGLIASGRTEGNQRRYQRSTLRTVSVIRAAQEVGLTLAEIERALGSLPDSRTPTKADWAKLAKGWKSDLDARIDELIALRDDLGGCIGCGCLSLKSCAILNADDRASAAGSGARYIMGDERPAVARGTRFRE